MKKNRRTLAVLLLFSLFCLALLVIGVILYNVPRQAEVLFGPPSPSLGAVRRYMYAGLLLWQANDLTRPVNSSGEEQPFEIAQGESAPSVIGRLQDARLIRNPAAFRMYLTYSGLDTSLQAGKYALSQAMSPLQIAHQLQDAIPKHVNLNILPGWRMEEIAASLATSGLSISPEVFLTAAHSRPEDYTFSSQLPNPPSLEGFLFPDSYELPRTTTAYELISTILDNFDAKVTREMRQGFARQNLDLYQAVTLASMIQREAVVKEEMPLIASVFLNRLNKSMKLDSDPTVQYAIGSLKKGNGWWKNPLSLDDLKVNSPYNTYQNSGLPPGPIANPGLEALKAVAFPAQTPYYYFRAACDGSGKHLFSETFDEHLNKECP